MLHVLYEDIEFIYNDSFDVEHHPMKQEHLEIIKTVNDYLKMGSCFYYHATTHGVLFWSENKNIRFTSESLHFLMKSKYLRYIENNIIALHFNKLNTN